jgi:hypothetical protein
MDSWDYEGQFLEQFPANYRGAVGNEFCKVIRDGAETPKEVLTAVCAKQTRRGPCELSEMILQKGVLASEGAYELAEFLLEREALPAEEKYRLKEAAQKANALTYGKAKMSAEKPTSRQLSYLESLRCPEIPTTKLRASELIDKYIKLRKCA